MTTKSDIKTTDAETALPSMHIDHSANFANELDSRLMGFQSALLAVAADMEGMQAAYDKSQAEAAAKHSEAMAARDRLKRDITRSQKMAQAARDVYVQDIPVMEGDE